MKNYFLSYIIILSISFFGLIGTASAEGLYFVFLHSKADKEVLAKDSVNRIQDAHMANIERLYEEGIIVAAGPFEGGGGIFIMEAQSLEVANDILQSDPGIRAKRWDVEVIPINIYKGKICRVPEKYQMATYGFLLYRISENEQNKELLALHDAYMGSEDDIIFACRSIDQRSFMILHNSAETNEIDELLEKDPLIKKGYFDFEIKKLWIARETFCQ